MIYGCWHSPATGDYLSVIAAAEGYNHGMRAVVLVVWIAAAFGQPKPRFDVAR